MMSMSFSGLRRGRNGLLCMAAMFAVLSPAAHADDATKAAPAGQKTGVPPAAADAAKRRVEEALDRYYEETQERLRSRLERLKGFFEKSKEGAPLYASAVLDLGAKGRLAGSFLESFVSQAGQALGFSSGTGEDSFTRFARQAFHENVIDRRAAVRELQKVLADFRNDLVESEGRLFVSLGVDVPDDAIARGFATPDLRHECAALDLCESLIADAVGGASTDLGASLGMFVVSSVLGDELAKRTTPENASQSRRFATNLATGIAVDAALNEGVKAMGYDPERALVMRTRAGIDRICNAVIEGDASLSKIIEKVTLFRWSHPDAAVRAACNRANEAMKRACNLGMSGRLQRMRNERYLTLWRALMTHFVGPEAASSPHLMFMVLDPSTCSPPDQIIRWAERVVAACGDSN